MFAKEGAKVCIVGRNERRGAQTVAEIEELGAEGFFIKADVGDSGDMQMIVNKTVETYGKLDIMVNNTAIIHQARLLELEDEDWDKIIRNNLRSVFLGSKYAAIQMVKQGHAAESSICPRSTRKSPNPRPRRTRRPRAASRPHADHCHRAGALQDYRQHPGSRRDLHRAYRSHVYASVKEALYKRIPLKAIAHPEDIACGALFMASDEAWYMTGARICIDGGYEMDGSLPDAEYWTE
jgi:NAD(P)-dependent dehydrogenase (short-subunit alcohol dehydrogenase family)